MAASEMKGFIFCVIVIISISTLLTTLPTDFQGLGETGSELPDINPSLITGFADSETYSKANFSGGVYEYELNDRTWNALCDGTNFNLIAKKLILGVFWLGGMDICSFTSEAGTDRGAALALTEITADAEDGAVRYTIEFDNGNAAGYLVCYWNTTEYATASLAWAGEGLYFIHGVGIDDLATNNIGALLLSFLTFQTPGDMPLLVNLVLGLPTWACLLFVAWYLIVSMIPFVTAG